MGIEYLKRWHWVALSVPLGLLAAWAMLASGPSGMQSRYATLGAEEFEARVLGRETWFGKEAGAPLDVRAYPLAEGAHLVTMYLPVEPAKQDEGRRWYRKYRAHQFTRGGGTYVPLSPMKDPPQFHFAFDEQDVTAAARQRAVVQTGWLRGRPGQRGVGPGGATLEFPLHKGPAYELMVRLAGGSEKFGGALQVKLNDQALPALKQDSTEPTRWRTTVPAGAVRAGAQVLTFAAAGGTVPVGEVQLINPAYTLANFLADAKRQNPSLDYSYRYAWDPRFAYPGWVLASVVVVGGIWPTLLAMLVGAGFGRAPQETYDLSRFRGGEEPKQTKARPTDADLAKVAELAEALEKELGADVKSRGSETRRAGVEAEPVKELVTAPVEALPDGNSAGLKEYGGEYYPVARKTHKRDE